MKNTAPVQHYIDALALDLLEGNDVQHEWSPESIASVLELCPEQDAWLYEPLPSDPTQSTCMAIFRFQATNGVIFHMQCLISHDSEVLRWIGPADLQVPEDLLTPALHVMAA